MNKTACEPLVFIISDSLLEPGTTSWCCDFACMRVQSMHTMPSTEAHSSHAWVGLDVSKETCAVCLLHPTGTMQFKQFANDPTGHAKLVQWVTQSVPHVVCHFCLEATGSYSTAVAMFLAEAKHLVSVINPARIRYFALAQAQGNKTDKADARLIARFCRKEQPEPWQAATPEMRLLMALVRRLHAVQALLVQEQNRFAVPSQPDAMRASIQTIVTCLKAEGERLRRCIRDHLKQHDELRNNIQRLQSIPGIGETTAWDILVELPDVEQFSSAQAVAAYAGLAPREHRSGSSVYKKTHVNKHGNSRLRKAFYFPAVTAIMWNPCVKRHYERLRQAGKGKMVALAAAMRKLLMICYGVLKHQQPFQADWPRHPRAASSAQAAA